MRCKLFLIACQACICLSLWSQKPDFYADSLFVVSGKEFIKQKGDIKGTVKIYCDGEYISVIVNVKDDVMDCQATNTSCDHVEIWFALPSTAYPRDFEYNFHPKYIYALPQDNPYEKPLPPRFFSAYSEYSSSLALNSFTKTFDYPSSKDVKAKNLTIPAPETLKEGRIDYGLVHFAFFPDQRAPTQLNKQHYQLLEGMWKQTLGNFVEGVQYVVDKTETGYVITAQFTPQALGFVQLPKMEEVRCMVDVIDTDGKGKGASVLSSSQFHQKDLPISFNTIRFKRPLRTNSTQIPDAVFTKLDFHPVYTYTADNQWVSTSIETDMIAYEPQKLSKTLLEIKFLLQPIRYSAFEDAAHNSIKKLSVEKGAVNTKSKTTEYYLINGQVFESEVVKIPKEKREALHSHTFAFPDGAPGIILKNRTPQNAYGWGNCKDCYEEIISVMRIKGSDTKTILGISQGNTSTPYCQIGDKNFKGFYVYGMDWLREGKIMVLRLSTWDNLTKKRVKISWNDDGSKVTMSEIL